MNIKLVIPIFVIVASFAAIIALDFVIQPAPKPIITQQEIRELIDEWMNNPQEDDREQRLEIMKAYYTFEETGQQLSNDQEGLVTLNQIRKMVSLDLPREELDALRQQVRDELTSQGFELLD